MNYWLLPNNCKRKRTNKNKPSWKQHRILKAKNSLLHRMWSKTLYNSWLIWDLLSMHLKKHCLCSFQKDLVHSALKMQWNGWTSMPPIQIWMNSCLLSNKRETENCSSNIKVDYPKKRELRLLKRRLLPLE